MKQILETEDHKRESSGERIHSDVLEGILSGPESMPVVQNEEVTSLPSNAELARNDVEMFRGDLDKSTNRGTIDKTTLEEQ